MVHVNGCAQLKVVMKCSHSCNTRVLQVLFSCVISRFSAPLAFLLGSGMARPLIGNVKVVDLHFYQSATTAVLAASSNNNSKQRSH